MAIVKQRTLQDLITQGVEQARHTSEDVLVSQVIRVPSVEPLAYFSCAEGDRFFWSDPEQKVMIVGSENVCTLTAEGEGRFDKIEQQRRTHLEHRVMDGDTSVPAVGPVFFGGFAFDPFKQKTGLRDSFPDAELVLPELMLTVVNGESWLTTNCSVGQETDPVDQAERLLHKQSCLLEDSRSKDFSKEPIPSYMVKEIAPRKWMETVAEAASEIREEQLKKVVLSRELQLTAKSDFSPSQVLRRLSEEQPNSFLFAVQRGEECFLGASPERLAGQEGNKLISACIAGSTGRGMDPAEDETLGNILLHDEKNLHEHEVVVDMIRTAMEEVCLDVDIADHPVLYKMKDIQHLYTPAVGVAPGDSSLLQVVARLHPTPALGGFPQEKALEEIREVEPHNRGWYGAPIGWIDYKGDGEFAVAIRSGLLQGSKAILLAGNGIVGDSDPESEYRETQMKFRPMLSALGGGR